MTTDVSTGPGRLIEIDGEAAALLIRHGEHWEVFALDGRAAPFDGRRFPTPVAAEHTLLLASRRKRRAS
ncbi:MAG: hypothetical protein GX458_04435 [Phyllobacteriaceae bacterium]|nr:hypothetical protein [Phyllobacteriaceae bacterium]